MSDEPSFVRKLLELRIRSARRPAFPNSRAYANLDINGSDFIELVEEVERLYGTNLGSVLVTRE